MEGSQNNSISKNNDNDNEKARQTASSIFIVDDNNESIAKDAAASISIYDNNATSSNVTKPYPKNKENNVNIENIINEIVNIAIKSLPTTRIEIPENNDPLSTGDKNRNSPSVNEIDKVILTSINAIPNISTTPPYENVLDITSDSIHDNKSVADGESRKGDSEETEINNVIDTAKQTIPDITTEIPLNTFSGSEETEINNVIGIAIQTISDITPEIPSNTLSDGTPEGRSYRESRTGDVDLDDSDFYSDSKSGETEDNSVFSPIDEIIAFVQNVLLDITTGKSTKENAPPNQQTEEQKAEKIINNIIINLHNSQDTTNKEPIDNIFKILSQITAKLDEKKLEIEQLKLINGKLQKIKTIVEKATGDTTHVTGDTTHVMGDTTHVTGDTTHVTGATTPVTGATPPVTGAMTPVTGAMTPVTGDTIPVTGDTIPVTGAMTPVTGAMTPVTGDTTPVTGATIPVTGAMTPVTGAMTPVTGATTPVTGATTPVTGATTPGEKAESPSAILTFQGDIYPRSYLINLVNDSSKFISLISGKKQIITDMSLNSLIYQPELAPNNTLSDGTPERPSGVPLNNTLFPKQGQNQRRKQGQKQGQIQGQNVNIIIPEVNQGLYDILKMIISSREKEKSQQQPTNEPPVVTEKKQPTNEPPVVTEEPPKKEPIKYSDDLIIEDINIAYDGNNTIEKDNTKSNIQVTRLNIDKKDAKKFEIIQTPKSDYHLPPYITRGGANQDFTNNLISELINLSIKSLQKIKTN